MADLVYRPSLKKVLSVTAGLLLIYFLLFLSAYGGNTRPAPGNALKSALVALSSLAIIALYSLAHGVRLSDNELVYHDFPATRRAPIQKILGVGLPQQNCLAATYHAHVYVWYDDPKQPGRDRYIRLRCGLFDETTLVRLALDIKRLRPEIKFDAKMEAFIKQWTPAPDAGKGLWHFLTKRRM